MKLTISGYAKLKKVSKQFIFKCAKEGRIRSAVNPAKGVWLIDSAEPVPKKLKPWDKSKNN